MKFYFFFFLHINEMLELFSWYHVLFLSTYFALRVCFSLALRVYIQFHIMEDGIGCLFPKVSFFSLLPW